MSTREAARLGALRELNLLDTPPSESFDRITRMAGQIFQLPIAAVSLTDRDRQWFKSRIGVEHWEIPRNRAPCSQVAETCELVVVPDLLLHETYSDSLLAQAGVRFYAGAPLITREGLGLGAMCVLGVEPRTAAEDELKSLQDLAAMVMAQIELQHAFGRIDPASGLPNRNQFIEDLEDLGRDAAGEGRLAVLVDLIDTAQLSQALRVMGPGWMDDLVRSAAQAIRSGLDPQAKLYQTGATHFAFLLPDLGEGFDHPALATLRARLEGLIPSDGALMSTSLAIGVAPFRIGQITPGDVLRTAHSAAQDAREADIGIGVYSASLDQAHRRRFTLLTDIPYALAGDDQLSLVYQPRLDLRRGDCVGAEALLRWRHPILGEVSPGEFIPMMEQTALAKPVTEWVLDAALRQVSAWRARGFFLPISINVSAVNLEEEDFATRVIERLDRYGASPHAIELEFTESALIRNFNRVRQQLEQIGAAGVKIAIDDFGTGYSSLSYLQRIPASVLKIDQSFIRDLGVGARGRTLVRTMISLAHDLGYRAVAEGVETREVYDFLDACGCDEVQGYLISRPQKPADLEAWVRRGWEPERKIA